MRSDVKRGGATRNETKPKKGEGSEGKCLLDARQLSRHCSCELVLLTLLRACPPVARYDVVLYAGAASLLHRLDKISVIAFHLVLERVKNNHFISKPNQDYITLDPVNLQLAGNWPNIISKTEQECSTGEVHQCRDYFGRPHTERCQQNHIHHYRQICCSRKPGTRNNFLGD